MLLLKPKLGGLFFCLCCYFVFYSPASFALVYKCTRDDGVVFYQESPCKDSYFQKETLNIQTKSQTKTIEPEAKPLVKSSFNRPKNKYIKAYTTVVKSKIIVEKCKKHKYDLDLSHAFKRYQEIAAENIKKGKQQFVGRFKNKTAANLREFQLQAETKKRINILGLKKDDLRQFCLYEASRLRVLAAQIENRSSGYVEGDLDPEGND